MAKRRNNQRHQSHQWRIIMRGSGESGVIGGVAGLAIWQALASMALQRKRRKWRKLA